MSDSFKISVFNSEQQRNYDIFVRLDRLLAFYNLVNRARKPDTPAATMPGLSWGAFMGLDAIFERRPKKFPTHDILAFLAKDYNERFYSEIPLATTAEIEKALEVFSTIHPPDVSEPA